MGFVDCWFLLGHETSNSIVILVKLVSQVGPHVELLFEYLLSDGHLSLVVLFDASALSLYFPFESDVFLRWMVFQRFEGCVVDALARLLEQFDVPALLPHLSLLQVLAVAGVSCLHTSMSDLQLL